MELLAPPTPRLPVCHNRWIRRLGFTHYDAYKIASTGYAVSYAPPTDTLVTGQEKTTVALAERIGGKIRNHCTHLNTLRSMLRSHVGPTCRGPNVLCIRPLGL